MFFSVLISIQSYIVLLIVQLHGASKMVAYFGLTIHFPIEVFVISRIHLLPSDLTLSSAAFKLP